MHEHLDDWQEFHHAVLKYSGDSIPRGRQDRKDALCLSWTCGSMSLHS